MQKIVPCLWVAQDAGTVATYYAGVFKDATIQSVQSHEGPHGAFSMAAMELLGQEFQILAAGPMFKFTEAVSFVITCETQEEVDYYHDKLSAVPEAEQCGWLKDRYGLSWQIVPSILYAYLSDPDKDKVARVRAALYRMKKLDIAALTRAYGGE